MTNFAQTMHDWQRMCKYYDTHYNEDCCEKCPLGGCGAIWEMDYIKDWEDFASKIEDWAEKHPEPVYPTWREYLMKMGLIVERNCQYYESDLNEINIKTEKNAAILNEKANRPISAEIAAALGLEPKA